ncbi:MAG: hypothetical protein ACI9HU_001691, partial [Colwellia sp.]
SIAIRYRASWSLFLIGRIMIINALEEWEWYIPIG